MKNLNNKISRLRFNKKLVSLSIIACFALAGTSLAIAKSGPHEHFERGGNDMRILKQLDLSEQQKVDIKALVQKTKDENDSFGDEKHEMRMQMQELMSMPTWDAQTARQLIGEQIEQNNSKQLNHAQAKHAVYKVLTKEQQAEFAEKMQEKRAKYKGKGERKGEAKNKDDKREGKRQARIAKALDLSDEQQTQFKAMHAQTKALRLSFAPIMKAHRAQEKSIIQADIFDTSAWQILQDNFAEDLITHRLQMAETHYNTLTMLNDEQKEKFKEMMKKMKGKGRK